MSGTTVDTTDWSWLRRYPFEDVAATFTVVLGEILRDARQARGFKRPVVVKMVARELAISTLMYYEHGRRHIGFERLLDVCIAFDEPMPRLIEDTLMRTRERLENGTPTTLEPDVEDTEPAEDMASDEPPDEAVAGIRQAIENQKSTTEELTRGRRAITENLTLKDELAALRVRFAELRKLAEVNQNRADAADEHMGRLRKRIVDDAAAHTAEVTRIRGEHERKMAEYKQDARAALAEAESRYTDHIQRLMREHAERMEQVVSGRPHEPPNGPAMAAPEMMPEPDPRPWQAVVRAYVIAEDADPFLVRVYNTLSPVLQFVLAGVAYGVPSATIANSKNIRPHTMDRDILLMCRRFRKRGEPEISPQDLKNIGRELFGLKGDSNN